MHTVAKVNRCLGAVRFRGESIRPDDLVEILSRPLYSFINLTLEALEATARSWIADWYEEEPKPA